MNSMKFADMKPMPPLVLLVQMCGALGIPIGSGTYEEAITKHPEYFPEEVENREKWNKVPVKVMEDYLNEFRELEKRIFGDIYNGKGLFYYIDHAEEARKNQVEYNQRAIQSKPEFKALHEKYFAAYGLTFKG